MKLLSLPEINFIGKRTYAIIFSAIIVAVSIFSLASQGLKFGIDFTGGTLIEVGYSSPVNLDDVRETLAKEKYNSANVQYFGSTNEIAKAGISLPTFPTLEISQIEYISESLLKIISKLK